MTPALEEAQRLLRLARRDRDTLRLLLPLEAASIAALGFQAQQAVEKALKAICALRGVEFRRTHDLAALGQALIEIGEALPLPLDDLRALNPFAVEFRYDDEMTSSVGRDELDERVAAILRWAEERVERG